MIAETAFFLSDIKPETQVSSPRNGLRSCFCLRVWEGGSRVSETSLRIEPGRHGQGAELGSGMEHACCREPMGLEKENPPGWGGLESFIGILWCPLWCGVRHRTGTEFPLCWRTTGLCQPWSGWILVVILGVQLSLFKIWLTYLVVYSKWSPNELHECWVQKYFIFQICFISKDFLYSKTRLLGF